MRDTARNCLQEESWRNGQLSFSLYYRKIRSFLNNTAASTTRLFSKQWKATGTGVSTPTLNCIVTDRAVNDLPDSVSSHTMRLTRKPATTDVYIAWDINARRAKDDVFTVDMWYNAKSVTSAFSTSQPRVVMNFRIDAGKHPPTRLIL